MATKTARCQGCEVLTINGVRCHESGCPDAWRDYTAECRWCGQRYAPESRYQRYCSDDCAESDA